MSTPNLNHKTSGLVLGAKILYSIAMFMSVFVLVLLAVEILKGSNVIPKHVYLDIQLLICSILMIDFWYQFYLSPKKWKFFVTYFVLLLVSIPYYNIVNWFDISVTATQSVMLRAIIFIRGGYGLIVMINWFTKSKVTHIMITYLILLVAMAYFGSLVFYSIEKGINPSLRNF